MKKLNWAGPNKTWNKTSSSCSLRSKCSISISSLRDVNPLAPDLRWLSSYIHVHNNCRINRSLLAHLYRWWRILANNLSPAVCSVNQHKVSSTSSSSKCLLYTVGESSYIHKENQHSFAIAWRRGNSDYRYYMKVMQTSSSSKLKKASIWEEQVKSFQVGQYGCLHAQG